MTNASFQERVKDLLGQIHALEKDKKRMAERKLPSECYFLSADTVLSYRRGDGDARYPYASDGMTLWAYTSGNIKMEESVYNVFLPAYEGKEPNVGFFAGIAYGNGFFPISLLGTARQAFEKDVRRYTVFTPNAAYYLTETPVFTAAVRLFMDEKKLLRVSLYLENTTDKEIKTYLSTYMDCLMTQWSFEQDDAKFFKQGKVTDYGYFFHTSEGALDHYGVIARSSVQGEVFATTSRQVYAGSSHNQLSCAQSLLDGFFTGDKKYVEFTETAIVGDMLPFTLDAGKVATVSYTGAFFDDKTKAETLATTNIQTAEIDEILAQKESKANNRKESEKYPEIKLSGLPQAKVGETALNYFIENVLRQVEFCARAKNYAGPFIGIRDIFQQLEASIFWIPEYSRGKIIEALGYIGDDGRAPRQYSYPLFEGALPRMDLRPFIDQGVWIISTVYTYLTFTNDYSILDEICGYYHFEGYAVSFSKEKDTVLEHLLRVADYLLSKLAPDTGCLRALFGDWNDALDGLGRPENGGTEYGNGVSVMATLQLYRNLNELIEILKKTGEFAEKIAVFEEEKQKIKEGLQKHAIVENELGERKIVHGWGDNLRFKIGSYCDNDGISRDGVTTNAFWVLCGALCWDKTLKKDILASYDRLDSKYGLKTFEPYFAEDNKDVGRIIRLPKGTAENGATYIHATLFGILSLFEMGESKRAWEQIYKILPLTHDKISTSPFIMSNSYVYDEERGYDGESMSDWFTGSGCVLIKILVWEVFGILPTLDGLTIRPTNFFPTESASIKLKVKGCEISLDYRKGDDDMYEFIVNGERRQSFYDEDAHTQKIFFTNEELARGKLEIVIR